MRNATYYRGTEETKVAAVLNLDCQGKSHLNTKVGFLDHMLELFARHAFLQLNLEAEGDLHVDCHHTVEDCGIVLGTAIKDALGDKVGIRRFGSATVPMDDALVVCAIDISGRPYLNMDVKFTVPRLGTMDTEMIKEFFYAVSVHAGMNIHFVQLAGENNHHIAEAMFKAFGQAFEQAIAIDPRIEGVRSTKGSL